MVSVASRTMAKVLLVEDDRRIRELLGLPKEAPKPASEKPADAKEAPKK